MAAMFWLAPFYSFVIFMIVILSRIGLKFSNKESLCLFIVVCKFIFLLLLFGIFNFIN